MVVNSTAQALRSLEPVEAAVVEPVGKATRQRQQQQTEPRTVAVAVVVRVGIQLVVMSVDPAALELSSSSIPTRAPQPSPVV